jgi:hypothetical protein
MFFSVQVFVKSSPPEKAVLSGMVSPTNWALSQLESSVAPTGGVALGAAEVAGAWLVAGRGVAVTVADGAPDVSAACTVSAAAV